MMKGTIELGFFGGCFLMLQVWWISSVMKEEGNVKFLKKKKDFDEAKKKLEKIFLK